MQASGSSSSFLGGSTAAAGASASVSSSRIRSGGKSGSSKGKPAVEPLKSPDNGGSSSSRKSKLSRSSKLGKSKKSESKSGALETKVRRRPSRGLERGHGSASLVEAGVVIIESVRLVVVALISVVKGKNARRVAFADLGQWVRSGKAALRSEPKHAFKLGLYIAAILFALMLGLQYLGLDVGGSLIPSGSGLRGSSPEPGLAAALAGPDGAGVSGAAAGGDGDGDEDDDLISDPSAQGSTEKKKLTKKEEIAFACKEVACIEKCVRKSTKKCLQSETCIKQRASSCKKKCRKSRCESRCKVEPATGYVEREMKTDKCKEDCQMNNKCIEKCEREGKTCKARCGERRKKFTCDREPDIPWPSAQAAEAAAAVPDDDEGDDDDGSSGDAFDDATEDAADSSGGGGGGGGGGDDDDDDEI